MPPTSEVSAPPRPGISNAVLASIGMSVAGALVIFYGVFGLLGLTVSSTTEFCSRYKCGIGAGFVAILCAAGAAILGSVFGALAAADARRAGRSPMRAALISAGVVLLLTFGALLWWTASGPFPEPQHR